MQIIFLQPRNKAIAKPEIEYRPPRFQFLAAETFTASSLHIPKFCHTIKSDLMYPKKSLFSSVIQGMDLNTFFYASMHTGCRCSYSSTEVLF